MAAKKNAAKRVPAKRKSASSGGAKRAKATAKSARAKHAGAAKQAAGIKQAKSAKQPQDSKQPPSAKRRRVGNQRQGASQPPTAQAAPPDTPSLFRINIEVGNLAEAADFYSKLFGIEGRAQAGSRVYFTCGPVTLQVVDVSSVGKPHPAAKALYFIVKDLDAVFARAQSLSCLSTESVHGTPGGAISVRPWGERSFYAADKWENPLCFVEAGTVYPG